MLVFALIGLALLLALLSLRGDAERARYVAARMAERLPDSGCPPVTVIVPVKGHDEGLAENLASLAALDYPDFELIVAARERGDVPGGVLPERARLVTAGGGDGDRVTGEKIRNLLAAVHAARAASGVFAFADSDGRVERGWLRALVAPLADPAVGASTAYRWHMPDRPAFWPMMRSAWNAVIFGGFGPGNQSFAWGGAMALRRETFVAARVADYWRGAVSDDYRLAEAIRDAGLRIAFAPGAVVASVDSTGGREFLSWIARQMIITRVYRPGLWWAGLIAHAIYCAAMVAAAVEAPGALVVLLALGWIKARNRAAIAKLCFPALGAWFEGRAWMYGALSPVATWLWLYSFAASAFTRRIRWRGRVYDLRNPGQPGSGDDRSRHREHP